MWLYIMIEHFQYIGNNSISGHVTSGLTIYSVLCMHIVFGVATSYRPNSKHCEDVTHYYEHRNKVELPKCFIHASYA